MRLLSAEPCSTTGLLFPSQYLSGTIFVIDGTGGFQEQGQCLFVSAEPMFAPFLSPTVFLFSYFIQSVGVVELGSSGWANLYLPAMHCQLFSIIIKIGR